MSRSRRFLIRMVLFLVLVAALAVALGSELVNAFMGNPGVNGVILGILIAGIAYIFRQVLLLQFPLRLQLFYIAHQLQKYLRQRF